VKPIGFIGYPIEYTTRVLFCQGWRIAECCSVDLLTAVII